MRCSGCSDKVRPVVALDVDGLLGDYHGQFSDYACRYWGLETPVVLWDGEGEMEDYLGLTKEQYREAKLAYRQGGNKRWMPLYPNAVVLTHYARDLGIEVWIATARPWQRLDNIDPDTRWWLDRNGFHYDYLIYGEDKYDQLLSRVECERIILVLDDLREQVLHAQELGLSAWQIRRPHNRAETAKARPRTDMPGAIELLRLGIEEWRAQYAA